MNPICLTSIDTMEANFAKLNIGSWLASNLFSTASHLAAANFTYHSVSREQMTALYSNRGRCHRKVVDVGKQSSVESFMY